MSEAPIFEGTFLGDLERLAADARLECGVCWWVYDPANGDPHWQVPSGTPFKALPTHWRCPQCDGAPSQFLVLDQGAVAPDNSKPQDEAVNARDVVERLVVAYGEADARMRGLPVHNPLLEVEATGFVELDSALVGVVVTPWCMNLVRLTDDAAELVPGNERSVALPAAELVFHAGNLPGFGPLEQASLFSPMTEFADQSAARAVAHEALQLLLKPPKRSRRDLLRSRHVSDA